MRISRHLRVQYSPYVSTPFYSGTIRNTRGEGGSSFHALDRPSTVLWRKHGDDVSLVTGELSLPIQFLFYCYRLLPAGQLTPFPPPTTVLEHSTSDGNHSWFGHNIISRAKWMGYPRQIFPNTPTLSTLHVLWQAYRLALSPALRCLPSTCIQRTYRPGCDKLCVIELGKAPPWEISYGEKGAAAEHESSLGLDSEGLGVVVVVVVRIYGDIVGYFLCD